MNILCIGPHVDDIELMCGGSIAKWKKEGDFVYYSAFSSAKISNNGFNTIEECYNSLSVLGIPDDNIFLYDFKTRYFYENRQKILDTLLWLRNKLWPDLVVVPSIKDKHQDHQVLAKESLRAFYGSINMMVYKQPWNCLDMNVNKFNRLYRDYIELKIKALSKYNSQEHRIYMKPDYIKAMARFYGAMSGNEYAEAFESIFEVK